MYIAHIRSEGDRLEAAVQESIDIAQASGAPAEIYHFKQAGRTNWAKLDKIVAMIDAARARGVRITADMYNYTAGATGLDAAMPSWVQDGGLEKWIARLKDPAIRARVEGGDARCASQGLGEPLCGRGPRGDAAPGVQESQAEAAHRQDAGRGREGAAAKVPKTPRSIW